MTIPPFIWEEIRENVLHIAADSIEYAITWHERVSVAVFSLGEMYGHAVDEDMSERVGFEVRKYVLDGTYLIHSRVRAERHR